MPRIFDNIALSLLPALSDKLRLSHIRYRHAFFVNRTLPDREVLSWESPSVVSLLPGRLTRTGPIATAAYSPLLPQLDAAAPAGMPATRANIEQDRITYGRDVMQKPPFGGPAVPCVCRG